MLFFFNDTATTEIYTLSLHDALPIYDTYYAREGTDISDRSLTSKALEEGRVLLTSDGGFLQRKPVREGSVAFLRVPQDRKSTRLNSSHANISYAVFCLIKKCIASYFP